MSEYKFQIPSSENGKTYAQFLEGEIDHMRFYIDRDLTKDNIEEGVGYQFKHIEERQSLQKYFLKGERFDFTVSLHQFLQFLADEGIIEREECRGDFILQKINFFSENVRKTDDEFLERNMNIIRDSIKEYKREEEIYSHISWAVKYMVTRQNLKKCFLLGERSNFEVEIHEFLGFLADEGLIERVPLRFCNHKHLKFLA